MRDTQYLENKTEEKWNQKPTTLPSAHVPVYLKNDLFFFIFFFLHFIKHTKFLKR